MKCILAVAGILVVLSPVLAGNPSQPLAGPVLDRPTLHSLGVYWIIRGDDNRNATISLQYRQTTDAAWKNGAPLYRVEKRAHMMEKYGSTLKVPADGWLFAGSVLLLDKDSEYEMKLTLSDPDGGKQEKILKSRTRAEPVLPQGATVKHVAPGNGGGTGTSADPFRGLAIAQKTAKPGDLFLIRPGTYAGNFKVEKKGLPGKPIVWRGAANGPTIIDAKGQGRKRSPQGISASGASDVWFENLTVRNADFGIVIHDTARVVIRRCHIHGVDYGITGTRDTKGISVDHFISDNVIEGPSTWPRTKGIEEARGIQVTGQGHVVCYNRIRGFADAIDTFGSSHCSAIDFHNNDVSELTDDGFEMDYSERNTRNFHNRLTNCFQGISMQPVHGGPTYVFRNVMYNIVQEPFKLHNSPSGCLVFHNTVVKKGMPLVLLTNEKVRHTQLRNNLFIGTTGSYAFECTAPMVNCDFDYDGFGGGPYPLFLKWNNVRYKTLAEVKAKAPVYKHALAIPSAGCFASGVLPPKDEKKKAAVPELQLAPKSAAVDAGQVLPGFNDGYTGMAPDLGAYEIGGKYQHYGPRPTK